MLQEVTVYITIKKKCLKWIIMQHALWEQMLQLGSQGENSIVKKFL